MESNMHDYFTTAKITIVKEVKNNGKNSNDVSSRDFVRKAI
jgi:hypothetical protein